PVGGPEHVPPGVVEGAGQARPGGEAAAAQRLPDDVGDVRDAPGPAARLAIVVDRRLAPGGAFGGVGPDRQVDRTGGGAAARAEEQLEAGVGILGDDVHVPV